MLPFGLAMQQANAAIHAALADCEIVIDGAAPVPAVWRSPSADDAMGMVSGNTPIVTVTENVCATADRGVAVHRVGDPAAYRVIESRPDGSGLIDIVLERMA